MIPKLNAEQLNAARKIMSNNAQPFDVSSMAARVRSSTFKHDLEYDFGYPRDTEMGFDLFYKMWKRHGFGHSLVEQTKNKTWQDNPSLVVNDEDTESETEEEKSIRRHFRRIRFWQKLAACDKRSMVGKYSGLVLQLGDGKAYDQPVKTVEGGIEGIISVIPCWEKQLEPSDWDTNPKSATYGQPTMYRFNENAVDAEEGKSRSFSVHPDRCFIWSEDGTTWGDSKLEPCYNALLDLEKIRGAGGEGYWKNSKAQPVLQASEEVDFTQLASMLGTDLDGLPNALDEVMERWSRGFDNSLTLQGMEAKTIGIDIQEPKSFFDICIQEVAASWPIPQKILIGMQTGERASTEDAREWSQINMARRNNQVIPNVLELVDRLVKWGILSDNDWTLKWPDLTAPTLDDKLAIGERMSRINGLMSPTGEVSFSNGEIRQLAGYPADGSAKERTVVQKPKDDESGVQTAPRPEDV